MTQHSRDDGGIEQIDGEKIAEANRRLNVVNGHHWKESKRSAVGDRGGYKVTEWECRGCGKISSSKNAGECPSPTIWVKMGAPGDGVGRCRDCDALFVFERPVNPPFEHPCPECGRPYWFRTDETDVDPEEVLTDVEL